MRIAAMVLCGAVILGVSAPASAQIIDQDQPSGPVVMAAFSPGPLAQSFQTQDYDSIVGAGILLWDIGVPGDITIRLWDALPTEGGTELAQATAVGSPNGWFDVFWDEVAIEPDTTYYLTFDDGPFNTGMGIAGDENNPYPFGNVFAGTFQFPTYNPFPDFDFAFRTWVPEPEPCATIDQDQPSGPVVMAAFSPGPLAQSFQTQAHDSIVGAGILLWDIGVPGDITIGLWDALPTEGGTELAQATAVGSPNGWFDVFWDEVAIEPDTTYYLTFDDGPFNTGMGIAGDENNPYPFGNVFAGTFQFPTYNPFPDFDFAFRTWVPCEASLELALDIKPGSCPNPLNTGSQGVLPAALLGTADFDVTQIDAGTVVISRADGVGGSAAARRTNFEDVATPFEGEPCDCHDLGADGFDDLTIKFGTQDVVSALALNMMPNPALLELVVSGNLLDGTPFVAADCIHFVPPSQGGIQQQSVGTLSVR